MGITAITRDSGNNVNIVRITTTDDLATALANGYITAQEDNIDEVNNGPFDWLESDSYLIYCSDGFSFGNISSDFTTLEPFVVNTTAVGTPFTIGNLIVAASTGGNIGQASGYNYASGLLAYPNATGITANAGGGQGSATALTKEVNNVTTVATAADSVKLPTSVAGLKIVVLNNGANNMQVFGAGTDTINGVATATGVSQLASSAVLYVCPVAGVWFSIALGTSYSGGSLPTASYANALTAHAGGGQGSALALTALINRVTTVATAADSVKLPTSTPGLEITIINSGANRMQVFGAGTDTINGVATATGVSQLAGSVVKYTCTAAGLWFSQEVAYGVSGNLPKYSVTNAITAFAGGGQGSAVLLTTSISRVTTVATAGDSVKLPTALAGLQVTVVNAAAANAMDVFPNTGDVINALAANTALSVAANKTIIFTCAVNGTWNSLLTA
jgi:hypothetical protein